MIQALLAAILHVTDIVFDNDFETDGVYIEHEEMLEMGMSSNIYHQDYFHLVTQQAYRVPTLPGKP